MLKKSRSVIKSTLICFSKFLNSSLVAQILVVDFINYSAKCTLILFPFVLSSCNYMINFVISFA